MNIIIKTNTETKNKRCSFELNNRLYYAFQNKSPMWTVIYVNNPNVMLGDWLKYSDSINLERFIDEFMMSPNTYEQVNTLGGEITK